MTDVDLRTFEPSWKSIPTPPSPIELSGPNSPGINPVDFGPSTISEGGEVDLPLPEEEPLPETPSEEGGSYPWQVSLNDDGNAVVSPGKVASAKTVSGNFVKAVMIPISYDGGVVPAGGAGWVYLRLFFSPEQGYQELFPVPGEDFSYAARPKYAYALSVEYSETAPADLTDSEIGPEELWIPLAEIVSADGELSVDQHVFDNIRITMEFGEITF